MTLDKRVFEFFFLYRPKNSDINYCFIPFYIYIKISISTKKKVTKGCLKPSTMFMVGLLGLNGQIQPTMAWPALAEKGKSSSGLIERLKKYIMIMDINCNIWA